MFQILGALVTYTIVIFELAGPEDDPCRCDELSATNATFNFSSTTWSSVADQ